MTKSRFITCVVGSWGLIVLGTWVAFNIWQWIVWIPVAAGATLFWWASMLRARTTNQPQTGRWAGGFYASGFVLVAVGFGAKSFDFPQAAATMIVGAGVWSVGLAWMCAGALWNGGWYLKRRPD
jgi:hypothetical protein